MNEFRVGVQCESWGTRCGIATYTARFIRYINELDDVEAKIFISKYKNGKPSVINIQYEPGLFGDKLVKRVHWFLNKFTQPIVFTAHHMGGLQQFYPTLDGVIIHDKSQIIGEEPWNYSVIPHPALVFPEKDKIKLRKKYGLPIDKKIIGTMGFICGTGKLLPLTVSHILKEIHDDEYLYLITPFWKGGDMGRYTDIMDVVNESGKSKNFRIETDYMADEEILNEKMQCCDLMYSWCNMPKNAPGSQSGSAADMYGSRVKLIVKDCPHYSFIGNQDKVLIGREKPEEFIMDVLDALRTEDLEDIQDPTHLSWQNLIPRYVDYFREVSE